MSLNGTKLTFRLTLDSRGDKASPMRRGTSATESAWQNRGSPPRSKDETGSRQLVEQGLRLLPIERLEALSEPVIDGGQKIVGLLSFYPDRAIGAPCSSRRATQELLPVA